MRMRGDRLRRRVRAVHLWLGIGLGGLFALLGLTGAILVFYPEIDALLHPAVRAQAGAAPAGPADWDRALATVRRVFPEQQGPWRFEVTGRPGAIPARYYGRSDMAGDTFRPMMVWLSHDGARVIRRDTWGDYAMTFIYDLHYRLKLGRTGGEVLGWSGFALLALLLSGVWAWWPRGGWAKALRLRLRGHRLRALRDWHKLAGLSGLAVLVVLTGTGIALELPGPTATALAAGGLPMAAMPHVHPAPAEGVAAGPGAAVTAALARVPGARAAWIETPPAAGGLYRVRVQVAGDPSPRFPHSYVWIDAGSGAVAGVSDLRRGGPGDRVGAWFHPLHDGSAFGLAGRIVVLVFGLLPLALFVTGWMRWRGMPKGRSGR